METVTLDQLGESLADGGWQSFFSDGAVSGGQKMVGSRLVSGVSGQLFETGDVELSATVTEKSGTAFSPAVAVWFEEGRHVFEGDCPCDEKLNCRHAAALLSYLAKGKGERLERAFGTITDADEATGGKTVSIDEPVEEPSGNEAGAPTFLFRVEKRPDGERSAWMPEVVAAAYAVYDRARVPLNPGGNLPPIVLPDTKITRNRAAETAALNCLYALNFLPGAEEPPQSLRKLDLPEIEGTLWAPDKSE